MLFAGIDWSDEALHFELRTAEGNVLAEGEVPANVAGLTDLFAAWEKHAPPAEIGVAIEATQAAWVQALLDRGYRLYPLNPKTVERFRESLSAVGHKSDRIDRKVIAMFLATLHSQLKPLRPDDPEIVALRIACEDRVRLVEERTAKLNEVRAVVKAYYPAFLGIFGYLESDIALQFLQEFPTQSQLQGIKPGRLKSWLRRHHYTQTHRIADMQAMLTQPTFAVPDHLQQAKAARLRYLAGSLLVLNTELKERERQITETFEKLPEADWYRSLPGAGSVLAPALLACVGRDPDRFETVEQARALMGTAPVTKQSGRFRAVYFRRGCWKFARRTLQLFAEKSCQHCDWARAYYEQRRASGHKHHAAVRALAHKWLKIILALKRTGRAYEEQVFLNSRQRYLSKSLAIP